MEKLKLFRICCHCNKEFELEPYKTNAVKFGGYGANFIDCKLCGKRNDIWIRIEPPEEWNTRADGWIKITPETMPKNEEQVIATDGKVWYKMRMFGGRLSFSGSHSFDNAVTHWQPITLP